ncbi:hypothetical protein [Hirschia litorea]|uniref:Uncharacterized protein n=1 Tax=Hirschia litorea TaxID=1199156 RepID=A0ABW2IJN9_9PROT
MTEKVRVQTEAGIVIMSAENARNYNKGKLIQPGTANDSDAEGSGLAVLFEGLFVACMALCLIAAFVSGFLLLDAGNYSSRYGTEISVYSVLLGASVGGLLMSGIGWAVCRTCVLTAKIHNTLVESNKLKAD